MGRSCNLSNRLAWLFAFGIAGVLSTAAPASAQEQVSSSGQLTVAAIDGPLTGTCYAARAVDVYLPLSGGDFEVAVVRNKVTVVTFPSWVHLEATTYNYQGFEVEQRPHQVLVTPLDETQPGTRANVAINAQLANPSIQAKQLNAIMSARFSQEPETFSALIDVKPVSNAEYERRKAATRALAEQAKHARNAKARLQSRRQTARSLLAEPYAYPSFRRTSDIGDGPHAIIGRVTWTGAEPYMRFAFQAPTYSEHELTAIEIRQDGGDWLKADVIMDGTARTRGDVLAIIPPNGRVEGIVLIPDQIQSDVDKLSLRFHGSNATAPIVAAAQRFDFVPVPPEEIARRERAKQMIVSARVLVGAFWIADGTGEQTLGTTSMTGFGVRIVKGATTSDPSLAFEAEIIGARTAEAEFNDVTIDTTAGDLRRSATLGRVQFGGLLRFGDMISPVARVGLGFQAASFAAAMSVDGGSAMELDSTFEFNLLVTVGGGIDFRLGEHFLVGVALSGETPLGGQASDLFARSFGLSGHLGYGW